MRNTMSTHRRSLATREKRAIAGTDCWKLWTLREMKRGERKEWGVKKKKKKIVGDGGYNGHLLQVAACRLQGEFDTAQGKAR